MATRPMDTVFVIDPIAASAMASLARVATVVGPEAAKSRDWTVEADGLIVRTSPIPAARIAASQRLRVIGKHGVGVDNIDLPAAKARGIAVISTPGANAASVTELVLGLAMALARRISTLNHALRQGDPIPLPWKSGIELAGTTIGVVGMGDIGCRVATLFQRALECRVLGFDPHAPATVWQAWEQAASLTDLLTRADIISLHLPLTEATRHLIGVKELALLKPTALLINTARGGLIDEVALAQALAAGQLAGAACDVFEVEPPPASHPLLAQAQFIATPHVGGSSTQAMERMGDAVVAGVLDVLGGRTPAFRVV